MFTGGGRLAGLPVDTELLRRLLLIIGGVAVKRSSFDVRRGVVGGGTNAEGFRASGGPLDEGPATGASAALFDDDDANDSASSPKTVDKRLGDGTRDGGRDSSAAIACSEFALRIKLRLAGPLHVERLSCFSDSVLRMSEEIGTTLLLFDRVPETDIGRWWPGDPRAAIIGFGVGGGGAYISERRDSCEEDVRGVKSCRTLSVWDWVLCKVDDRVTRREDEGEWGEEGP